MELELRRMRAEDATEVRQLHERWFPVKYGDAFYEGVLRGLYDGRKVDACVATDAEGRIAGMIILSRYPTATCGEANLLASPHPWVFYIMTIGVCDAYRRRGVGSQLVTWAFRQAQRDESVGAIFLHVIAWNSAAMAFYQRNGYRNLALRDNYYHISGEDYACYVYGRSVNGGMLGAPRRPGIWSWVWSLLSDITSLFWRRGTLLEASKDTV